MIVIANSYLTFIQVKSEYGKTSFWRVGLAIMQRTKLETQSNFDKNFEAQNALTEKTVINTVNLNQIIPKQLEVFIQNHLGMKLSYRTIDDPNTEKEVT